MTGSAALYECVRWVKGADGRGVAERCSCRFFWLASLRRPILRKEQPCQGWRAADDKLAGNLIVLCLFSLLSHGGETSRLHLRLRCVLPQPPVTEPRRIHAWSNPAYSVCASTEIRRRFLCCGRRIFERNTAKVFPPCNMFYKRGCCRACLSSLAECFCRRCI